MENTYKTSEVAKIIGIHPNTVRLYEDLELIPKANRLSNGYRIFNDYHIEQFNLARTALKVEVLQNGLRKKIINIIKLSAKGEFEEAIICTNDYINQVKNERRNAEEAIEISKQLLLGIKNNESDMFLTRKQTAEYLNITIDTLRNWEMNGLLSIKRKENGYRVYTSSDIKKLKIIRTLRCANYSLASILRMINAISNSSKVDIKEVINTPDNNEDIVTACDKLLTSLNNAEKNANVILKQLRFMNNRFNANSPF
ncbi:MerR family transcriptional regulator [Clostridium tertium]|jgi:DNA-binding transcriptional MerR regulator|uniref:MerR family transcriptional regulator n=1 Tax=Clostridium TaxID=1485 RepID=UPI000BE34298|nr:MULTISPECIES: MerR family transcriptional regulator [Clostridium]MBP1867183.1 DNA-binding transcriptional MerR regulator [Clostridium tertium]MBS5883617.1 MerR family transcriptional regulator [Clostridium sp.]MBU6135532.1 MerR family transcriptional regulator [Clostridium tertium]MDB1954966.1 MerR family transcriptional regulator [Clostridium tertium]MDB1959062.1 MerR family transcriptional regulator [Clostridium tertium]